jgi:hypothetical protein
VDCRNGRLRQDKEIAKNPTEVQAPDWLRGQRLTNGDLQDVFGGRLRIEQQRLRSAQ